MSNPPDHSPSDGRFVAFVKAATPVLVAVITAAGGYGVAWLQYRGSNQPIPQATTVTAPRAISSPGPEAVKVTITPADGPVPRCATIKGTASIPDDKKVWVAYRYEQGVPDTYGFTKVTVDPSHPDQLQARLELGVQKETKKRFVVNAFALGSEATRLLDNIETAADPQSAGSYYFLRELPAQGGVASETFERDSRGVAPC